MPDLVWQDFTAADALPGAVEGVTSTLGAAVTAVKTALGAVKLVFQTLKTLTIPRVDILEAALISIREDVEAIIETLEEAGIRSLVYAPVGHRNVVAPDTWMSRVVLSMTDPGDPHRPDFSTQQGMAGAVIMVVGADFDLTMAKFKRLMDALFAGFEYRPGECLVASTDGTFPPFALNRECLRAKYPENEFRGQGVAPDWKEELTLRQISPIFGRLAAILRKSLSLFVYGAGLTDLFDQYIAYLERRIAILDALAAELAAVAADIEALANVVGFHVMFFEGTYTTVELQSALLGAGLPEGARAANLFAVGTMIHVAGDPSSEIASTVELLRGITG